MKDNWFEISARKIWKQAKRKQRKKKRKNRRRGQKKSRVPQRYKVYIRGRYWTERKHRYFSAHAKRCAVCRTTQNVALHHLVYGNYGAERDEDLIPLCGRHHSIFHALHGVARNMKETTAEYVYSAAFEEEADRALRAIGTR